MEGNDGEFSSIRSGSAPIEVGSLKAWIVSGTGRLGVSVPKSVGSAVVRNRTRRRLKAAWRELASDVDGVIRVSRPASYTEIHAYLSQILEESAHG